MDENALFRIQKWLNGPYDEQTKNEIRTLQKENSEALYDAFYRDLSFGTGGMRGIMGIGTNRINIYTIRAATQGLANYLLKHAGEESVGVFIGYDVRHHSRLFAEESAKVLAGNGIAALITQEVCPTPLASFGCRHYGCSAAIMITASHNPPEYNGYKVYGYDGAQIVSPSDEEIIDEVRQIQSPEQIHLVSLDHPLIRLVGNEIDREYLSRLEKLRLNRSPKSLQVLYTNLHGTGLRLVPKALEIWGFSSPRLVKNQAPLDGSFPAAISPNPEEESSLFLGSKQMLDEQADLLLATDPDADRIGLVVRNGDRAIRLNGNEIACVCFAYLAEALNKRNEIPDNAAIIKTIVTTELLRKIAEDYSIRCVDVLTGFKFIAKEIREWEESFGGYQFLFGAEESHGYLFGTFVRDKDGVGAACLIAEAAEKEKAEERTLIDSLHKLYQIYGVHRQSLSTIVFKDSSEGLESMRTFMQRLRSDPPNKIGNQKIMRFDDVLNNITFDGKKTKELFLPPSDVLVFWLEDQTRLAIRPSGTEPKIKIYLETSDPSGVDLKTSIANCDQRLQKTLDAFQIENQKILA